MEFTYSLAIADFIPVVIYFVVAIKLASTLKDYMPKSMHILFRVSTSLVFATGLVKAFMKVLFVAGVRSEGFEYISNTYYFSTLVSLYYLAGTSIVISFSLLSKKKSKKVINIAVHTLLTAIFAKILYSFTTVSESTMFFVLMLVVGNLLVWGSLSVFSFKKKSYASGITFIITFLFLMAMGSLNTRDFTSATTHLIAESVNIVAHLIMLTSALLLSKKVITSSQKNNVLYAEASKEEAA